ncbi:MAG: exonuclease domain-containing protein [Candidatus Binatia bacterium]
MRAILHQLLSARAGTATAAEMLDLVFDGRGHDSPFGRSFLAALLADDPRFREDSGLWYLVEEHVLDAELLSAPFVVVDLETTGHRPDDGGVTEIGAIRLEGLREVGRFETLVHPGRSIPSFVTKLTGISDAMVAGSPRLADVIGGFAEFAEGAVLVAHNAAFDARLLDHACRRWLGRPLGLPALCTVKLAQRLMPEQRRTSLEALSAHFGLPDGKRHRAMADAERTVDLLARFVPMLRERGATRVHHLIEAQEDPVTPRRLEIRVRQADLEDLPDSPGVYRLIGREEEPLFVGRATNLRERVLQYFLDVDHMSDRQLAMVAKTYEVSFTRCGSPLEAALLEASDVHRLEPAYNRGDRHLPRSSFVKVTVRSPLARVFVAGRVSADGALYIGPLRGRAFADDAAELVAAAFRLRTCPGALRADPAYQPCELGSTGRCSSPCNATVSVSGYATQIEALDRCLRSRFGPRELMAAAGVVSGASDYGRLQAAARRLERLAQRSHWLVNALHYLAVAPSADGDALFVAAVVAGRCIGNWPVADEASIDGLLQEVRRIWGGETPPRDELPTADASTILAVWLQENDPSGVESLIPLEDGDEASLLAGRERLRAMLEEKRRDAPRPRAQVRGVAR